jgi:uncharacterized membrane protein YhaH (DUF805 family)
MKKVTRLQYLSLLWIARILGIFYAVLLGLFSLDSVKEDSAFWANFQALFLHLIPFILVIAALVLGWKRLLISGAGLIVISIAFLMFFKDNTLVNQLVVIGPGILNGLLFVVLFFIKPGSDAANKPFSPQQ